MRSLTRRKIVCRVAKKIHLIVRWSKQVGCFGRISLPIEVNSPMARSYLPEDLSARGVIPVIVKGVH